MQRFYYVAPLESREMILREGILPPIEVMKRIKAGQLNENVLGVSFRGFDKSNFVEFVSLTKDYRTTKRIAEALCFSRTGNYFDGNFMAAGYCIDFEISQLKEFVSEEETKRMNSDSYPGEVLFRGRIEPKYIGEHVFAVRPNY